MVRKFTDSLLKNIVEDKTNNAYSLLNVETIGRRNTQNGKREKRKITIKHNECKHIYTVCLYEFTDGKRRCPKCKGKVLRTHFGTDIETIKNETIRITEGKYKFIDEQYVNAKTKHKFQHLPCGTVFEKKWEKFKGTPKQAGQRCPNCQRKGMESMASLYTKDILEHFNIPYEKEKRFTDCINLKTGKVLPFDYYLPEINLIIEIDGEQHERASFTTWDVEGTIKRDAIKNKYAEKNGITLVRIPAKEWSALPKFLYKILSEIYIKDISLEEVKAVKQSSRPESIIIDLKKLHNGEYSLHDNFYTGCERKHLYIHLACGNVFETSYANIKYNKYPCPRCRETQIKQDKYDTSNTNLLSISKGRYSLSKDTLNIDEKGRRLIHCHRCNNNWRATVANLLGAKTGCPSCHHNKKENAWDKIYTQVISAILKKKKLNKKYKYWVWRNKKLYHEGNLSQIRIKKLRKVNLNLLSNIKISKG